MDGLHDSEDGNADPLTEGENDEVIKFEKSGSREEECLIKVINFPLVAFHFLPMMLPG